MKLRDAQYEWNPVGFDPLNGTPIGAVRVYSRSQHIARGPGRDRDTRFRFWSCMDMDDRPKLNDLEALAFLLVDFHTCVVRDGIDPQKAHRQFLKIDEYRRFISPDCEGAER